MNEKIMVNGLSLLNVIRVCKKTGTDTIHMVTAENDGGTKSLYVIPDKEPDGLRTVHLLATIDQLCE